MKTATSVNVENLLNMAAANPDKLDALNELVKNMIILVDLTGKKAKEEIPRLTITTTKTVNSVKNGSYYYTVVITDGKRNARFVNSGEKVLTMKNFIEGTNANGLRFWSNKTKWNDLTKFGKWEKGQLRNEEYTDMREFIAECLKVTVEFTDEAGEKVYYI